MNKINVEIVETFQQNRHNICKKDSTLSHFGSEGSIFGFEIHFVFENDLSYPEASFDVEGLDDVVNIFVYTDKKYK